MFKFLCSTLLFGATSAACPPDDFSSINNFDVDTYISKRWYVQQQMETSYLPKAHNWCVFADYRRLAKKSFWGYDVQVHNHAEEEDGSIHDSDKDIRGGGGIMARIVDESAGKLKVAPWFVPSLFAGPYWVIAYDEQEGYALVSGGAPTLNGNDGKCRTGSGTNNAGLWIFTRAKQRDERLVAKVRGIAELNGFDSSVLNDVENSKCRV